MRHRQFSSCFILDIGLALSKGKSFAMCLRELVMWVSVRIASKRLALANHRLSGAQSGERGVGSGRAPRRGALVGLWRDVSLRKFSLFEAVSGCAWRLLQPQSALSLRLGLLRLSLCEAFTSFLYYAAIICLCLFCSKAQDTALRCIGK